MIVMSSSHNYVSVGLQINIYGREFLVGIMGYNFILLPVAIIVARCNNLL